MNPVLVVEEKLAERLARELLAAAPRESGVFCLLSEASRGGRLILGEPLTDLTEWKEQAEERLTPAGQMISAAISAANATQAGLAFVHTHPSSQQVPGLSLLDMKTTNRLSRALNELIDGPFAAVVLAPGGWAGAVAHPDGLEELSRVTISGRRLRIHQPRDVAAIHGQGARADLDDRQLRALGYKVQTTLKRLHAVVVGVGGLGSPLAETLTRMGIGRLTLIDHDLLDTPSNARRVFGVRRRDVESAEPLPKAKVVARYLNDLDLGTLVEPLCGDVLDAVVQDAAVSGDVIFGCTDTHASRAVLAEICVRAVMPLIDVGVRIGVRESTGLLDAMRIERRIQVPGGPCLWCWNVIDPQQVRFELASDLERSGLIEAGYVAGFEGGPAPSVAALTVTASGTAASALLGLLADTFTAAPLRATLDALTLEAFPLGPDEPDPECICARWRPA